MTAQSPPRTPSATLSPAAECWWERIGDCTYLVLSCPGLFPELTGVPRISLTDTEAKILRGLLNNPEWWSDKALLDNPSKGANTHGESERI